MQLSEISNFISLKCKRDKQIQVAKYMMNLLEYPDEFSNVFFQQQDHFPKNQPIINFIQKQSSVNKKGKICPWNENLYDDEFNSHRQSPLSPKLQNQRKTIKDFLSSIRVKNCQSSHFRSNFRNKKKMSSLDNYDSQKAEIFMPLNNTVIAFPKSRNRHRNLENDEKIILQKLYMKRQKSKIIPKQIQINPNIVHPTINASFPAKNYLSRNRTFIEQKSLTKIYNPESKSIKDLSGLRRRFSNSYYKKVSSAFLFEDDRKQKLLFLQDKRNVNGTRSQGTNHQIDNFKDQNEKQTPKKMYKTLHNSLKPHNVNLGGQREFSISKVREQAKNSHLNRTKVVQKNDIQLLGSTIAKWKNQAQKKLKKSLQHND